ncbi:hypothetical protein [Streptomyces africanus]|uniref:hypothetical protein n=1 Tax=Streptomyces africanus TaxID=231024 RepID=UPI000A3BA2B2|nr:hypothetical protein [Streptomyces africanus]
MSRIGENHPDNPFSAAGRANGQTNDQLRNRGLDGQGNPLPNKNFAGQKSFRSGGSRNQGIAQLAQSIGDMDLANQEDLHAFCDAIRKILNYFAISVELAKGQLKAASRQMAKESVDGRLTMTQRAELARALSMMSRDLDAVSRACIAGAVGAVKAWRRFDSFLGDLDKGNDSKFTRPGGRGRGPFTVV